MPAMAKKNPWDDFKPIRNNQRRDANLFERILILGICALGGVLVAAFLLGDALSWGFFPSAARAERAGGFALLLLALGAGLGAAFGWRMMRASDRS